MAIPFNPPNPYGSYFNFGGYGDPSQLASDVFLPQRQTSFSPGTLAAIGAPVGGFMPSRNEYIRDRMRDTAYQQFLADTLSKDARAGAFTSAAMSAMYGNNNEKKQALYDKMGGVGNTQNAVSFLLNMPGVSGYMGGNIRSIGMGSLAAATSGLTLNGYGMFGDGQIQMLAASGVRDNIMKKFYGPGGSSNLSMTQGLNRDQIGGLMMAGSVSGAFAGLDMGQLEKSGANNRLKFNESSMKKITDFTKDAAKFVSSLIDVYGDSSVTELLAKGQSITGLDMSRMKNATLYNDRLRTLRQTGTNYGIDVATMYDTSAGATAMGLRMGMDMPTAGTAGVLATSNAAAQFRRSQINAGVMEARGSYLAPRSFGDIAGQNMRDISGMSRDPAGARIAALVLAAQQGNIRGDDAAQMMAALNGMTPIDVPNLDAIGRKYGIHLPSYIQGYGGSEGVMKALRPEMKETAMKLNDTGMQGRAMANVQRLIAKRLVQKFGSGPDTAQMGEDFSTLIKNLEPATILSMLDKPDTKSTSQQDHAKMLDRDFNELDRKSYQDAATRLRNRITNPDDRKALYTDLASQMHQNARTQNLKSKQGLINESTLRERNLPTVNDSIRGELRRGILEGILKRLEGNDEGTLFNVAANFHPDQIAGLNPTSAILFGKEDFMKGDGTFDYSKYANAIGVMQREFSKLGDPGKRVLSEMGLLDKNGDFVTNMTDAQMGELFASNGDSMTRDWRFRDLVRSQGPGGRQMFARRELIDEAKDFSKSGAAISAFGKEMGNQQISDTGYMISTGKIVKRDPNTGKLVNSPRKDALTDDEKSRMRQRQVSNIIQDPQFYNETLMDADKFKGILKADLRLGQEIVNAMSQREMQLADKTDPDSMRQKKVLMDRQTQAGHMALLPETKFSRLTGDLNITGDGKVKLLAYLAEGKK